MTVHSFRAVWCVAATMVAAGCGSSIASGVEWSSGNSNTLTVNQSGVVVGVNAGVTSVNVAYSGATGSVDCTVGP